MSVLRIGAEAIMFQASSARFDKLVAIFQDAINYRDSIDYEKALDKDPKLTKTKIRHQEMLKYSRGPMNKAFKEYCKKEWGFTLKKLFLNQSAGITGMFAVDLSLGDEISIAEQMNRYSGSQVSTKEFEKDLLDLQSAFDPKSNKITKSTWGADKINIAVNMYFDQNLAFLGKDHLHNDIYKEDMTAEEMAAIMTHEIYHLVTLIDHAGDSYYKIYAPIAHLNDLLKHTSTEDFKKVILPKARECMTAMQDKKLVPAAHSEKILRVLDGIDYSLDKIDESVPASIGKTLMQVLYGAFMTTVMMYSVVMNHLVIRTTLELIEGMGREFSGKTSDTYATSRNYYHIERLADEGVSKSGASRYLATGLNKIRTAFRLSSVQIGALPSQRYNRSKISMIYLKLLMATGVRVFEYSNSPVILYEDDKARVKRLLQNNMQVYKNLLSGEERDYYLADAEGIMREFDKQGPAAKKFLAVWDKILDLFPVTSPGQFILRVLTGNFSKEMDKLLNSIEDIIGTKMNYFGAKFSQLAEKNTAKANSLPGTEAHWRVDDTWESLTAHVTSPHK